MSEINEDRIFLLASELAFFGIIAIWTDEENFMLKETTPEQAMTFLIKHNARLAAINLEVRVKGEQKEILTTKIIAFKHHCDQIWFHAKRQTPSGSDSNEWSSEQVQGRLDLLRRKLYDT